MTESPTFIQKLDRLYNGQSRGASLFRYGMLAADLVIILFFVVASFTPDNRYELVVDWLIALFIILDFAARFAIAPGKLRFLWDPVSLADILVIVTLLAAAIIESFAFLRVVRAIRLLRSYHVLKDLRQRYPRFRRNEEIINSVINLVVFIFFVTALVYVFQADSNPRITNYADALYFSISTLTTTGYGDITLLGTSGRLLSVFIMFVGVALFLRLVQAIFRPAKVAFTCPDCGLSRHDIDAVHCKHCGRVIRIETPGV